MKNVLAPIFLLALAGCGGSSGGSGGNSQLPSGTGSNPNNGGATARVLQWVDKPVGGVSMRGELVQGNVLMPKVSQLGQAVSFLSSASNLVPGDTNNGVDLFVYTRANNTTVRANIRDSANQTPTNLVSYATDYDLNGFAFTTENTDNSNFGGPYTVLPFSPSALVREGRGLVTGFLGGVAVYETRSVDNPAEPIRIGISDGSEIAGGDSGSSAPKTLLNFANGDCLNPQLVPGYDQRLIFFYSTATNLVPNDTNGVGDIFCYFTRDDRVVRVSEGPDGQEFNGESLIGQADVYGYNYAFTSRASNVVAGDTNNATDVFLKNLQTGQVKLISKNLDGRPGNGPSDSPSMNGGADRIVFQSRASDLVPTDTNGQSDVFLWVGQADVIAGRLSFSLDGNQTGSTTPSVCAIASYGDWVAFTSDSNALVPGVTVGGVHLYLTNINLQEGNQPYLPQR